MLFKGLSYDEASPILGIQPKSVATRYRRALRKLKQFLDERTGD